MFYIKILAERLDELVPGFNLPPIHHDEVCQACLMILNAYFCAVAEISSRSVLSNTTFPKPKPSTHNDSVKVWAAAIRVKGDIRATPGTLAAPLLERFRSAINKVKEKNSKKTKNQDASTRGPKTKKQRVWPQ